MAELDHLIFASKDASEGASMIEELTGAAAVPGGPHVGLGTHNYLLTFDDRTYFEIIGIDPDQPEPPGPRPFGLDDLERAALVGYAVHPTGDETLEDVARSMTEAGYDPGSIAEMSRRKPDGSVLPWRLTRGGDSGESSGGALPFAIDWGTEPSPAVSLPSMGSLAGLIVNHPDAAVRAAASGLAVGVEVRDGPARLTAVVDTVDGRVEIS